MVRFLELLIALKNRESKRKGKYKMPRVVFFKDTADGINDRLDCCFHVHTSCFSFNNRRKNKNKNTLLFLRENYRINTGGGKIREKENYQTFWYFYLNMGKMRHSLT